MWEEFILDPSTPLVYALSIIDDAMCNGFSFKVEDGKLYFKEGELDEQTHVIDSPVGGIIN